MKHRYLAAIAALTFTSLALAGEAAKVEPAQPVAASPVLPATAKAQPAAQPVKVAAAKPEKKICRMEAKLNSRLGGRKICNTKAEWKEIEENSRDVTDSIQAKRGTPGNQ
jgi:hypothetical protein